ncbi:MAG TPA: hypothetical protein VHY08_24280, partial [Bacillota bacterium]|nr:hypothetical protein [Bacillota bacterium]
FTSAANLLKVEQKGDLISLSVNGTLLENDYSIAGDSHYGSSYLYAGLYGESSVINTDFRFDDFELYAAVINDFSVFKASGLLGVGKVHKDIGR